MRVRSEGATLRLTTHGWLQVDAWQIEDLLDRAAEAERTGEPSAALDLYRRALSLYGGPTCPTPVMRSGRSPTGTACRPGSWPLQSGRAS